MHVQKQKALSVLLNERDNKIKVAGDKSSRLADEAIQVEVERRREEAEVAQAKLSKRPNLQ